MRSFRSAFLLVFLFLLSVISCTGRHSQGGTEPVAGKPEKGKICPEIRCVKNNSVSYALYLPAGYDPVRRYPVILMFDPHGSGVLPVEKYHALAEAHGYILAGSNNSKNGLPLNETGIIIQDLFEDIMSRYSIDSGRIYTAGFSGGSRIASLIALNQYGITGVIGCGAGFPFSAANPKARFDYIGIAGNSDFNMNELMALDRDLESAGFRHALILFNGIHAWPPAEVMDEAFTWTDFCAMKDNRMPRNQVRIDSFIKKCNEQSRNLAAGNDPLEQDRVLLNGLRFLKGLAPVNALEQEQKMLRETSAYKKALRAEESIAREEDRQQKMLTDNFFTEDLAWWKKTVDGYNRAIQSPKDSNQVRMNRRLKSYLSLVCYMSYTKVKGAGDSIASEQAMKIYEMVDPENAAKTKAGSVK